MKSWLWQYTSITFVILFSIKAWAAPITWDFAGSITSVRVTGTDDLSLTPSIGSPFSGTVTWNSTWANLAGTNSGDSAFTEPYGFTFDVGGHQYDATGQLDFSREGDYAEFVSSLPDGSQVGAEGSVDGQSLVQLQPLIAIDGIDGPLPTDPSDLLANTINWQYFQAGAETQDGTVFFTGELTQLTPVPEPAIMNLAAFAVGGLALGKRRKGSGVQSSSTRAPLSASHTYSLRHLSALICSARANASLNHLS